MDISRLSNGVFASIVGVLEGIDFGRSTRNPILNRLQFMVAQDNKN